MEALLALWERLPLPGTARAAMSEAHLRAVRDLSTLMGASYDGDSVEKAEAEPTPPEPDSGPDSTLRGHDAPADPFPQSAPEPTEPEDVPVGREAESITAADVGEVAAEDLAG